MPKQMVHSIQMNDPESGSALALLLTAAGHEVETDFCDGTVFISADSSTADIQVLDEQAPQLSAYSLSCELWQRLNAPAIEPDVIAMRRELHDVA